jgi:diguanylate cyclase (GGDEF)-like protein
VSVQALLDALPQPAWLARLDDRCLVAANAAAAALLGRPAAALVGDDALALASSPEDAAWWAGAAAGDPAPLRSDTVLALPDGTALPAERSLHRLDATLADADGTPLVLATLRDRRAELRAERERESLLAELQATLESTADGLLVTDGAGGIRAFNRRFAQIWGLPETLLHERDDEAVRAWMTRRAANPVDETARQAELAADPLLHASDRLQLEGGQVLERVTCPLLHGGRPAGRVWSFRDLTERLAAEQRIEALQRSDALTGLPNRHALAERFEPMLAEARAGGRSLALLVIDLDRFRQVNDTLGHAAGDRVLRDVARRLQGGLREHDLLARTGGDQFSVLLWPADAASAEAGARRLLNAVAQPCSIDDAQFTLTCSIGIALAPSHGQTLDDLARHAEAAMRVVKRAGRSSVRLHQARSDSDRREHMRLDHAMRQALVSNRFRLHYQPQVRLSDGVVVGAEALLRWRDPELGEVSPGRFIPVAEDSGFIVAIGDWVLGQAVRQAVLWQQRGLAVPIAVNVSALQFQQAGFVDRVAGVLAVSGLPPHLLQLELTESILLHDADEALLRLSALSRLGIALSIDDFGTGYSSLAYLKRFPIGKLKIDRSFVQGLPDDGADAGIVGAILQMAKALRMAVVAEGVETEAQRRFLLQAGCDEFQGFLYAPALDSLSFERRMRECGALPEEPRPAAVGAAGPRIRLVRG